MAVLLLVLTSLIVMAGLARSGLSARVKPCKREAWIASQLRTFLMPRVDKNRTNPFSANESLVKEAREHFADHCASGHASDGSGNTALGQGLSPQVPDMRLFATQSRPI